LAPDDAIAKTQSVEVENVFVRVFLTMFVMAMLSACAAVPVVSDFNGSSVKIQSSSLAEDARDATQGEADRICSKVGKTAEYASTRQLPDYNVEFLYLCL
jgi:starvation-inducible outer membrane lipoprotein